MHKGYLNFSKGYFLRKIIIKNYWLILQEMKVLNSDEIEGLGLVIEIQKDSE